MTSQTEISKSRGIPSGTSDLVLDVLRRYSRPVSLQELLDAGVVSRTSGPRILELLLHRHDIGVINVGSIATSIEKRYYAVRHG